jgi:hypothetical protein
MFGISQANAAGVDQNPVNSWNLHTTVAPGNSAKSFRLRWIHFTDGRGEVTDVCETVAQIDANVTGIRGEGADIQAYSGDNCSGSVSNDLSFIQPDIGGAVVSVTFDGSGVHLG